MPGPRPQKNLVGGGWLSFTSFGIMSGEAAFVPTPNLGTSVGTVSGPGDYLLQAGPGRLDELLPMPRGTSGLVTATVFYDAAVAGSGGPFILSGHRIVSVIGPTLGLVSGQLATPAISGVSTSFQPAYSPVPVGFPFNSGLCVAIKSGQAPYSVSFSTEPAIPA